MDPQIIFGYHANNSPLLVRLNKLLKGGKKRTRRRGIKKSKKGGKSRKRKSTK